MEYGHLMQLVSSEPVFSSALLLAGRSSAGDVRRQLSRWVTAGRLLQVRRGWYVLPPAYRKVEPHPFLVANRIKKASYVSLQAALSYYGLIPEYVPVVTSVTTGRPETLSTPLGTFQYRHVAPAWFTAHHMVELGGGQSAFLATPEKALLDLLYLTPDSESAAFLDELRLQHTERINAEKLQDLARQLGSPKVCRAVGRLVKQWQQQPGTDEPR